MAHLRHRDTLNDSDYESCPVGGEWWKCEDINYPTFIGCCSSNPCSGTMCPADNLYPMGFGSITSPAPDYPNHSCPYGGLWYTCADNTVPFQGCCESNPCNGQGCPSSDLRAAAVHTVSVAGGSTYTVPATVSTVSAGPSAVSSASQTASTSSSTAQPLQQVSHKSHMNTAAIAGGSVAAGVVLLAVVGLSVYCCLRRRRAKHVAEQALDRRHPAPSSHEHKDYYQDVSSSAILTPLPNYTKAEHLSSSSRGPTSPAPTYTSLGGQQPQDTTTTEPQEIMGLGLTAEQFNSRSRTRSAFMSLDGPAELASHSQQPSASAVETEGEAERESQTPLLGSEAEAARTDVDRHIRLGDPAIGSGSPKRQTVETSSRNSTRFTESDL